MTEGDRPIDTIEIDFRVRAAGTVSGFASNARFDGYTAAINFGFALSSAGRAFIGGGGKSIDNIDGARGSIETQAGSLRVRPGEGLDLLLRAELLADTALSAFANSASSSAAVAGADFAHTLEWEGVQGFRAFDAIGGLIDLGSGRFTMLDGEGNDFWFSAASFNNPVPEPASWAMMIAGFGLAGAAARRRRAPVTA